MRKSVILTAAVITLLLFSGAASAAYIYPYTNIADYDNTLAAGDTLALVSDAGKTSITLSGSGGSVFFAPSNFVPGVYTKSIAGTNTGLYYVTGPDAKISIQIYGVAGSELSQIGSVSRNQGLVFRVTPYIPIYKPKALLFETQAGGSTTCFGTNDSTIGTPTGLVPQPDGSYTFTVTNLADAKVPNGGWDVRVIYDAATFNGQMPASLLKGSSYGEQQMSGSHAQPTPVPTSVLVRTVTPTPVKVKTVAPTPVKTQAPVNTPEKTPAATPAQTPLPTPTPTPEPTKAPANPIPFLALAAGLIGACAAVLRK